jgi:hypothetical protein
MEENKKPEKILKHEELLKVLDYNPDTGIFTWKIEKTTGGIRIKNKRAGSIYNKGYRYIKINKERYRAGRLAFFYVNKRFPELTIDHINRIRDDDRICNLREVDYSVQNKNRSFK